MRYSRCKIPERREQVWLDFTGTEDEIMAGIRQLVSMLPANNEDDMSYEDCTDDLNRVCADLANAAGDTGNSSFQISQMTITIRRSKSCLRKRDGNRLPSD